MVSVPSAGGAGADPVAAASALVFSALQVVPLAAPKGRWCALVVPGRTEEAGAEARRVYATGQDRRWFLANPNGADAVAAETKAADAARERTARPLDGDTVGAVMA